MSQPPVIPNTPNTPAAPVVHTENAGDTGNTENTANSSRGGAALRTAGLYGLSLLVTWSVAFGIKSLVPRLVGPSGFGDVYFSEGLSFTFFSFVIFGFDTLIQREAGRDRTMLDRYLGPIVLWRVIGILFVMLGLSIFVQVRELSTQIWLLGIGFAAAYGINYINQSLQAVLQAIEKMDVVIKNNMWMKGIWGILSAVGLLAGLDVAVVPLALLITEIVRFFFILGKVKEHLQIQWNLSFRHSKMLFKLTAPFYAGGLLTNLQQYLDSTLMEFSGLDSAEKGYYGSAWVLVGVALVLIPLIMNLIYPMAANAYKESEDEFYHFFGSALWVVVAMSIPISLFLALGAPLWVRVFFGPDFAFSVPPLMTVGPYVGLVYWTMSATVYFTVVGREWLPIRISVIAMVIGPILKLLFIPYVFKTFGEGSGATAMGVSNLVLQIVTSVALLSFMPISRIFTKEAVASISKMTFVSIVTVLIHVVMLEKVSWEYISYVAVFIDLAFWLPALFLTKAITVEQVKTVANLVRNRKKK